MRKHSTMIMAMAMAALLGACGGKADPAAPAKVEAPVSATPAPEAKAAPTAATPAAPAGDKVEASAAAAAGGEHAGCGEHAMAAAPGGEADCPFPDEKAGAMEGCGAHAAVEPTKTATGMHFGTQFAMAEAKPLASVLAGATDGQELSVRVSGQIDKVCQKRGCWMVVKDGDIQARVIMKDHAFTVPLDSQGKAAQVEGVLKVRVFSEAQAKHLAEDGGEDPNKVKGETKELILTATAVEIGG